MRGNIFRKSLVIGIIGLFLLTNLSIVTAMKKNTIIKNDKTVIKPIGSNINLKIEPWDYTINKKYKSVYISGTVIAENISDGYPVEISALRNNSNWTYCYQVWGGVVDYTMIIGLDFFPEKNNNITVFADSDDFYKEYNENDNCYSKVVVISKNLKSDIQPFTNLLEKIVLFINQFKIFNTFI